MPEPTTHPIWIDILIVTIPTFLAGLPSILSAIYVRKTAKEKKPIEEMAAGGGYTKDISTGYKELNKTCQEMLEMVAGQVTHLQEVQKVSNDTIVALQDTNKLIQGTLDRVLEESQKQEELINQLLHGINTLISQLKEVDPNVEPKFKPEDLGL